MPKSQTLPFGMHFLQAAQASTSQPLPDIRYDEALGYSVIFKDGAWLPLASFASARIQTMTVTEQHEDPEDSEGEHPTNVFGALFTVTATKDSGENPDDGDDDKAINFSLALVTITVTRSSESPEDGDDDRITGGSSW